jgi:hypothetical protein
MAITKAVGFKASDGVVYATIEEAQKAELEKLLNPMTERCFATGGVFCTRTLAGELLTNADAILSILTTGPRTRPKARKAAGTTNPKRAAKRATPEQAQAGFTAMRTAVAEPEPIGAD